MAAYVIANVNVQDATLFEEYRKRVPETVARHGGRTDAVLVEGV